MEREVDSVPTAAESKSLNDWLESKAKTGFQLQKAPGTNQVMTVLGGRFPNVGESVDSAYDFLSDFSKQVGAPADSLDKTSLFQTQTKRKRVVGFDQTFKGYKVFDAYARVHIDNRDGAAYVIMNNIKPIEDSVALPEVIVDLG